MLPELLFSYFAGVIILLSILVVTRKNPVHSVLWMLLLFFHIAGLYLLLNAEFLAAIQVILYAGAILVLFLFVIMLLNLKEELRIERFIGMWRWGLSIAIGMLLVILLSLRAFVIGEEGGYTIDAIKKETHTVALGRALYTEYLFPFEVVSLILLVAIIGAIVLAKKKLKG